MGINSVINITFDVFYMILSALILVCIILGQDQKDKLSKIFLIMLMMSFVLIGLDMIGWIWDGSSAPHARTLLVVATFLFTVLGHMVNASVDYYFFTYISLQTKISKKILYVMMGIYAISIIITIVLILTGGLYYYDANNTYTRGTFRFIYYLCIACSMMFDLIVLSRYVKAMGVSGGAVFVTYLVFNIAGLGLQYIDLEVNIIFALMSLEMTLLIIYLGIQTERARKLKQTRMELVDSQISVMISQIQPHFVYNALTTIKNMIEENPERAKVLVSDFTSYLRQNMHSLSQRELIFFNQELNHLKTYLSIEKMRFEDRLNVIYDLEETKFMIPMLTIQPLVENAVRHGLTKKKKGGTVKITTRKTPEHIIIIISDDGVGFDKNQPFDDRRSHIGIINVTNRIKAQCEGELIIESEVGKGTVVTVLIPNKGEEEK